METDKDTPKTPFEIWWHNEGSAMRPLPDEDTEEHVKRVSEIAWSNGVYKAFQLIGKQINQ